MSRIFDALSRSGESAEIVKRVLGEESASQEPLPEALAQEVANAGASASSSAASSSAMVRPDALSQEVGGGGSIRTILMDPQAPVLLFDKSHRKAAEQYRVIRTRIVQHPKRPRVLTLTSGSPGDGKTFNAINLAGVLSLKDKERVLLIDGDLRRSSVAHALGVPEAPGLGEVLRGRATLRSALARLGQFENLYVLPAGEPEDRPAELLDSPAWRSLIEVFRKRFSYVVIDAPPVAAVADYDLIQAVCDGVVVVVRQDHTNRSAFNKALNLVDPDKRLGVILNSSKDWWLARTAGYYYYGDYGYYYSSDKKR